MAKKILIVDDSRTSRQQVSFTLTKGGYVVVEAEDGNDGITKLLENPDVAMIISDVNMPNKDGLEMCEEMSKDPVMSKYPIVMLTTEGAKVLIERARAAGAKGWLVKPFKPEQLIATVKKIAA